MGKPLLVKYGLNGLLLVIQSRGGIVVPGIIRFVTKERDIAAHNNVGIMLLHGVKQSGGKFRMNDIVAVHHHHQLARHGVQCRVACRRMATVGLMDDTDAVIALSPTVADGSAAIGTAIVHHDDFKVTIGLGDNALKALLQKRLGVIGRDEDRYERFWVHYFTFHSKPSFVSLTSKPNSLSLSRIRSLVAQSLLALAVRRISSSRSTA